MLGACPRIESLLQKSWICAISRFFSSNSRAILLKKARNRPKPSFPSSRFLFSDKLLGQYKVFFKAIACLKRTFEVNSLKRLKTEFL